MFVRYNVYFQRANTVSLAVVSGNTVTGGPYFPLTLYTLADPTNLSVAPFINDPNSELLDVKDPKDGEICPLNHEDVTLRVSQMAIGNTTELGQVKTLKLSKMAPSDKDAFQVPMYEATSGNAELLTVYDRSSAAIPPRYYEAGLSARRSDLSSILDRHSLAFDVGYCFTQTSAHKQRLFARSDKESGVQERQR